jgi:hypothetical protein
MQENTILRENYILKVAPQLPSVVNQSIRN